MCFKFFFFVVELCFFFVWVGGILVVVKGFNFEVIVLICYFMFY